MHELEPPQPGPVRYTVIAEIDDPRVAARYVSWLLGEAGTSGHAAQVLAWGGTRAEVCRLDPSDAATTPVRVECRYEFPSRDALDRYLHEGAPALREEGRRFFVDADGVRLHRQIGAVLGEVRQGSEARTRGW